MKGGVGSIYQPTYRDRKTGERRSVATFYIKYWCRGTCRRGAECRGYHRESTGSDNRKVAEKLLRQRLGAIGAGKLVGPDVEKTTFEHLATMFLTDSTVNQRKAQGRMTIAINHLRDFFGPSSRAIAITTDRAKDYIKARQKAGMKNATIQLELAALRRMFTLGLQAGKVAAVPYIPSLEVRNTRTGFFERPELEAVLAHLPDDLKPAMVFSYLTGWRCRSEVLPLQWKQVDFRSGEVRLEPGTTKNDEGRVFPVAALPPLGEVLTLQRERVSRIEKVTGQVIPHVFVWSDGRPIGFYLRRWRSACKKAGLPGRLVHDFRRTAVRNLERAGVPRSVAMKLTGHRTEAVYRRYAIVSPADLRAGVEKLAQLHASEPAGAAAPRIVPIARKARR